MIPVNIITGALGAGKTTAIARLLADKPATEFWLVILNEFTDTGIDTLTLAAAAHGAYDVRMIPGGCLCCTGEEDFRRQMTGVLTQPESTWPMRILIEPSGIGHPGAIVDELRLFERGKSVQLHSTIALLDAQRADFDALDATTQAQVDAADVVLLSKAELADAATQAAFSAWAESLFPRKRLVALSEHGLIPAQALAPSPALFSFDQRIRSTLHQSEHAHALITHRELQLANVTVQAKAQALLGREACGWIIPSQIMFELSKLDSLLTSASDWQGVERFKAVLRTDIDRWHLLQRWGTQGSITECNWRQNSRIEVQLAEGHAANWAVWDERWQRISQLCPIP